MSAASPSNRGRYGLGYQGRGRGKWNNQSGSSSAWNRMPNDRVPLQPEDVPKGDVLEELEVDKLKAEVELPETAKYRKEDYELLASYNWLPNAGKPAIVVPGLAARWTPPPLPAWLTQDTGLLYIDQNAHYWPTSPLEPALRALFTLNPTFDPNPIDMVTDRNDLRKLFRFACGDKKFIHDFKFYTEVINNTVLTTRWEKQAAKVIPEGEFRGFGHSFEKEFTKYTKGLEGSTSHNRVAKYRFGGLNLLVRFSADAFLGSKDMPGREISAKNGSDSAQAQSNKPTNLTSRSKAGSNSTPTPRNTAHTMGGLVTISSASKRRDNPPQAPNPTTQDTEEDLIDLSDVFEKTLKIGSENEVEKPPTPLEIMPGGILMPQERVLEVKTRVDNRLIDLTDHIPQLWFSDTSNLYVGYHHRGSFMRVDMEAMNAKTLKIWEDQNQDNLRKMSQLLMRITQVVRSLEGGRAQIACVGGKLKIYALQEGEIALGTLPADLREKWQVK